MVVEIHRGLAGSDAVAQLVHADNVCQRYPIGQRGSGEP